MNVLRAFVGLFCGSPFICVGHFHMFHSTFEMFCINVVYIYMPCTGRGLFKVSFVCLFF